MAHQSTIPGTRPPATQAAIRSPAFSWTRLLVLLLLLPLGLTTASAAQQPGQAIPSLAPMPIDPTLPSAGNHDPRLVNPLDLAREARRIQQLNILRQKSIRDDSIKLLRLARELNEALSAAQPTMSAAERLRKATEIEKLAKDVKEKMRYAGTPIDDPQADFNHWRY